MQAFGRPVYFVPDLPPRPAGGFDQLKADSKPTPACSTSTSTRADYYQEQSKTLATFIRTLGIVVTTIFSFRAHGPGR